MYQKKAALFLHELAGAYTIRQAVKIRAGAWILKCISACAPNTRPHLIYEVYLKWVIP